MSATNSAFLLAFVTTPIDSAHLMHYACGLVLSAHAHNIEYYGLVKVVKAHVWLVSCNYSQTGMQSPIESECKIPISRRLECKAPSNQNVRYQYLPSLDLVQRQLVVFWLISPRALYYTPKGLWGL